MIGKMNLLSGSPITFTSVPKSPPTSKLEAGAKNVNVRSFSSAKSSNTQDRLSLVGATNYFMSYGKIMTVKTMTSRILKRDGNCSRQFSDQVNYQTMRPPSVTTNGAPYNVIVEGIDALPLDFLKRRENQDHDDSIDFNSNDEDDYRLTFRQLTKALILVSTKLTLVACSPTISTAAEDTFKLTVEAPIAKTAEGPFRILIGGIASIIADVDPNSWQFRKHLILQMDVNARNVNACTVRFLADSSIALRSGYSSASSSSSSASAVALQPVATGVSSSSSSSSSASAVSLLLDDLCVLVNRIREHL